MPECTKCGVHIRTGTLCEIHAVERNAAAVDHDRNVEPICAGCEEYAPEGDYSETRRGMWFCPGCSGLALRREERRQVAAETPDVLAGAVRWAVGDADAYPDEDPAEIEAGFETASTHRAIADGGERLPPYAEQTQDGVRCSVCKNEAASLKALTHDCIYANDLVADGGPDLQEWAFGLITEQVADEGEEPQDKSLWTSKGRLKAEASKVDFVERDEVAGLVDGLEARGDIVYWHGLIAPATEEHISEIIASEVQGTYPREILIGRLNSAKQSAEQAAAAGGEA